MKFKSKKHSNKIFWLIVIITIFILLFIPFGIYKSTHITSNGTIFVNKINLDNFLTHKISNNIAINIAFATSTNSNNGGGTRTTTAVKKSDEGSAIDVHLGATGSVVKIIVTIFLYMFAFLIKLAAFFVSYALHLNQTLLDFSPPFVLIGWGVFRDIANLGFVFGIIIIAISTILRFKSYRMQSILWKLIAAALLVNFSLVIAGTIIKVSDVFSNYFLDQIAGGNLMTASKKIVDVFQLQNIHSDLKMLNNVVVLGTSNVKKSSNIIVKAFRFIRGPLLFELVGALIAMIMEILIFLVLIAFAFMLSLRYFYLAFLLILSPLALLLWIFPSTTSHWNEWWKKFIHWTLYAPSILFFLWLTLKVMGASTQYYNEIDNSANALITSGGDAPVVANIEFGYLMSSVMALAMLIGGMKISQSIGYGGTSLASGAWNKGKNLSKKFAINKSRRAGARLLNKADLGKAGEKLSKSKYANVPLAGGITRAVSRNLTLAGSKAKHVSSEYIEEQKKKFKKLPKDDLAKIIPTLRGEKRLAALSIAAENNSIGKVVKQTGGDELLLKTLESLKKFGDQKTIDSIREQTGYTPEVLKAKIAYEKESDEDKKQQALEKYENEINKLFQSFSRSEFKIFMSNNGNDFFKKDEDGKFVDVPGMDESTAKIFRGQIIESLVGPKAIPGGIDIASSEMENGDTLQSLYREIMENISKKARLDISKELQLADSNSDVGFPGVIGTIMKKFEKSSNDIAVMFVKSFGKSMASAIGGYYNPKEKEEKEEKKKKKKRIGF